MSNRPINNNIEAGGFWVFVAIMYLFFRQHGSNEFDLYDLIYQFLLTQIGTN